MSCLIVSRTLQIRSRCSIAALTSLITAEHSWLLAGSLQLRMPPHSTLALADATLHEALRWSMLPNLGLRSLLALRTSSK